MTRRGLRSSRLCRPRTEASRPAVFVIETDSRVERKRGAAWEAHFTHRYDVTPEGGGSRITYTETISRVNYVPYWLKWVSGRSSGRT
jgi:hypothetical protein